MSDTTKGPNPKGTPQVNRRSDGAALPGKTADDKAREQEGPNKRDDKGARPVTRFG